MKKILMSMLCLLAISIVPGFAWAEYPDRPVTLLSPFGTGGDSDLSARVWADFAQKELGQPVLVVNKPGGGGLTGTLEAAKAKPDGYTLFLGQAGPCIVIPLISKVGNLNNESFELVTRFIKSNTGIAVSADAPWKDLNDFRDAAIKEPNKYVYSGVSAGSWLSLAFRAWATESNVEVKRVEYNSGAEAATAIVGGHGDLTFLFSPNYKALVNGGKLKLLAQGAKSEDFPDVPTFSELGYAGDYYGWSAIVLPKGTPQEIVDKLTAVSDKISKDPEFIKAVTNLGFIVDNTSGTQFKKEFEEQYSVMEEVLKHANIIK